MQPKTLQRRWGDEVKKAKKIESKAKALIIRTGGGFACQLIDEGSAKVLAAHQSNVDLEFG